MRLIGELSASSVIGITTEESMPRQNSLTLLIDANNENNLTMNISVINILLDINCTLLRAAACNWEWGTMRGTYISITCRPPGAPFFLRVNQNFIFDKFNAFRSFPVLRAAWHAPLTFTRGPRDCSPLSLFLLLQTSTSVLDRHFPTSLPPSFEVRQSRWLNLRPLSSSSGMTSDTVTIFQKLTYLDTAPV